MPIVDENWGNNNWYVDSKDMRWNCLPRYDGYRAVSIATVGLLITIVAWAAGKKDQAIIFTVSAWLEFLLAFGELFCQRWQYGLMVAELFNKGFYLNSGIKSALVTRPSMAILVLPFLYSTAANLRISRFRSAATSVGNLLIWAGVASTLVLCIGVVPYVVLDVLSMRNGLLFTLGIAQLAIGDALDDVTHTSIAVILAVVLSMSLLLLITCPTWQAWSMILIEPNEEQDMDEVRAQWGRMEKMIAEQMNGISLNGDEMAGFFVAAKRGKSGENIAGSKMLLRLLRLNDIAIVRHSFVGPNCGLEFSYFKKDPERKRNGYPLEIVSIHGPFGKPAVDEV